MCLFLAFKLPLNKLLHFPFLCVWDCILLSEITIFGSNRVVKAKNKSGSNKIYDTCRCKTINLMLQNMPYSLVVVGNLSTHLRVVIQSPNNLGNVKARLHIQIRKGLIRAIKDMGILFFQHINHFFTTHLGVKI